MVETALQFLSSLIKREKRPGFLCLSAKGNKWKDFFFPVKKGKLQQEQVREFLLNYEDEDLYFCPHVLSGTKRRKDAIQGIWYLWADLDFVPPKKVDDVLKPSILWRSSQGRYQALWELSSQIDKSKAEKLNKALTYKLGADKSGWDLTQVLRIPGTKNYKYKPPAHVKIINKADVSYQVKDLKFLSNGKVPGTIPLEVQDVRLKDYFEILPKRALDLLGAEEAEVGKRSDAIWYLENVMKDAGLSPPEIISLIKESVWNKYQGRRDEDERLRKELIKITEKGLEVPDKQEILSRFHITDFNSIMTSARNQPGWLIEDFWMRESHGIVAGEPKSFKSTLVLDMCISIASGKPFLNKHKVTQKGPVIIVQNENAEWILKDRMEKILVHKKYVGKLKEVTKGDQFEVEFPEDLPIYFINQQSFDLSTIMDRQFIEALIKSIRPVAIVFDPLYLMFSGDINVAKDLKPILGWLLDLRNKYSLSVLLIHHWNKSQVSLRGGQKMLGSTTLHGWVDSAWYIGVEKSKEDNKGNTECRLTLEREFRGAGIYPKIKIGITLEKGGGGKYGVDYTTHKEKKEVEVKFFEPGPEDYRVKELFDAGWSAKKISDRLGTSRRRVIQVVKELTLKKGD